MQDRTFVRLGARAGIAGAIIFAIANIIHPRSAHIDVAIGQVHAVAHKSTYICRRRRHDPHQHEGGNQAYPVGHPAHHQPHPRVVEAGGWGFPLPTGAPYCTIEV